MHRIITCRHLCSQELTKPLPNWLNEKFVQKALEDGKEFSVKIENMKIDKAVPAGYNYLCEVYRVRAKYRRSDKQDHLRSKSLIIKSPIFGQFYDVFIKSGIEKEVRVYNELVPKLETLYRAKSAVNKTAAKSFYSSQENVLVLEDLRSKGYDMLNKVDQLDLNHCLVSLKTLARFHAGCAVIHDQEPKLVEELGKEIFYRQDVKQVMNPIVMLNVKALSKALRNQPDSQKYSVWLEEMYKTGFDQAIALMQLRQHEFNVLNHGDYGLQNMLVKYVNKTPMEIVLIDFQTCRFSSPALDMIHFIEFNMKDEVRDDKIDDLIRFYVTELNSLLEKYGSKKKLELSEFQKSIQDRAFLRAFFSLIFLGLVVIQPRKSQNLKFKDLTPEKLSNSKKNPFEFYIKNKRYLKMIRKRLKQFDEMGLVNFKK